MKLFDVESTNLFRTYKTHKGAEKRLLQLCEEMQIDPEEIRYVILSQEDGRFKPMLMGEEMLDYFFPLSDVACFSN